MGTTGKRLCANLPDGVRQDDFAQAAAESEGAGFNPGQTGRQPDGFQCFATIESLGSNFPDTVWDLDAAKTRDIGDVVIAHAEKCPAADLGHPVGDFDLAVRAQHTGIIFCPAFFHQQDHAWSPETDPLDESTCVIPFCRLAMADKIAW